MYPFGKCNIFFVNLHYLSADKCVLFSQTIDQPKVLKMAARFDERTSMPFWGASEKRQIWTCEESAIDS